jgi:hypothetical protein
MYVLLVVWVIRSAGRPVSMKQMVGKVGPLKQRSPNAGSLVLLDCQ